VANRFEENARKLWGDPDNDIAKISIGQAVKTNPDQFADVINLSDQSGLSPALVERNQPEVEAQVNRINLDKVNPFTQRFLEDFDNAKLSHDDTEELSLIETTLQNTGKGFLGVGDIVRSVPAGAVDSAGAFAGGLSVTNDAFGRGITNVIDFLGADSVAGFLRQPLPSKFLTPSYFTDATEGLFSQVAEYIRAPKKRRGFHTDVAEAVGQIATQSGAFALNPALGTSFFLGQGIDSGQERAELKGATQQEQDSTAILSGIATGISERLGIDNLLNRVPPEIRNQALRVITDVVLSGGVEALEENIEGSLNNLADRLIFDPDQKVFQLPGKEEAAAGVAAAIIRSIFHANGRFQTLDTQQEKAQERIDYFKELQNQVVGSKTYQRHKGRFNQFVKRVTEDQADPNVYIDAEGATQYFQSIDEDARSFFDNADLGRQYDDALASSTDVVIPISKMMDFADSEHYEPLLMDVRTNVGEMTFRETQISSEIVQQEIQKEADSIIDAQEQQAATQQSADIVFTDIRDQLVNAGQTPAVAAKMATLHRSFAEVNSQRLGISPQAFYEEYQLRIQGPSTEFRNTLDAVQDLQDRIKILEALEQEDQQRIETAQEQEDIEQDPAVNDQVSQEAVVDSLETQEDVQEVQDQQEQNLETQQNLEDIKDQNPQDIELSQRIEQAGFNINDNAEDIAFALTDDGTGFNQEFTQAPKTPRGKITFGNDITQNPSIITLLEDANLSTFLHESGHFFLEVYNDIVSQENAPEGIKKDFAILLDWFEVESFEQVGNTQHEQFAKGFEKYLVEGKAPTVQLQSVFDRFRTWLLQVYKNLRALDVNLTDSVRVVMDRMLANDIAINEAQNQTNIMPLFTSFEDTGISREAYNDYVKAYENSLNVARRDMDAEVLGRLKREHKKAWRDELRDLKDSIREELSREPVFQVRAFLTEAEKENKLAKRDLITLYGDGPTALWRKLPVGKHTLMTTEGGVNIDEITAMFGFSSPDNMISAIVESGSLNKAVTERAEHTMRVKHGDPDNPAQLAELAIETIQNNERATFLSLELRTLEKRANIGNTPRQVLKAEAARVLNQTEIMNIREGMYFRSMIKFGRDAQRFVANGEFQDAAQAKQKQLFNQYLYQAAKKAKDDVEKSVKYLKKFNNPGTRKNLDRDYLDQIDAILEAYDFKKSTNKEVQSRIPLREWIDNKRENFEEVTVPEHILERANKRNFKELSFGELQGVKDAVKNIEHLARFKHKLTVNKEKREMDAVVEEMEVIAREHNKFKEDYDEFPSETLGEKFRDFARWGAATHVKPEFLFHQLDGSENNGIWWSSMFRELADAETRELEMQEIAVDEFNQLLQIVPQKERSKWHSVKLNTEQTLGRDVTKNQIISMALNWGNDGNRIALMRGENWTQAQVLTVFERHMTKKDWQFVQSVWSMIDTYWPDIVSLQRGLTGVVPDKVQALPVTNQHGTFKGGYYPLKYDPRRSELAQAHDEKKNVSDLFGSSYTITATKQGHTKNRVGSASQPVFLDLSLISDHVNNVIHDLTHRKAVIQTHKLLKNKRVEHSIKSVAGTAMYRELRPWLANIASPDAKTNDLFSKYLNIFRKNSTIVNMGLKATTAIVQPLGILQSIEVLGKEYTTKGITGFYNGDMIKTKDFIFEKSAMMRNRSKTWDRDISDAVKRIKGTGFKATAERYYFQHIAFADYMVSLPTWLGAYQKSLDSNNTDVDAIAFADSMVRMSQSAGGAKDLATIQSGSPGKRALTMFYSYFSVLHNLLRRRAVINGQRGFNLDTVSDTIKSTMLLVTMPAILAELGVLRLPEEDEEVKWAAKLVMTYPFMTVVGVRDVTNALATDFDYSPSPLIDALDTIVRSGDSVIDLATGDDWERSDTKRLFMATGFIFGLPARQLTVTFDHLFSVANDEEEFNVSELVLRNKR
jgi:hypothetical protein